MSYGDACAEEKEANGIMAWRVFWGWCWLVAGCLLLGSIMDCGGSLSVPEGGEVSGKSDAAGNTTIVEAPGERDSQEAARNDAPQPIEFSQPAETFHDGREWASGDQERFPEAAGDVLVKDTKLVSRIFRFYTPDPGCLATGLLQNTCNGGTEVQALHNPTGTSRVYLGTSNWNDSKNLNSPAQVLYRDDETGPWLRTARLPAPTKGKAGQPLCSGFDQVNDLRSLSNNGKIAVFAAVGASWYGSPPPCWAQGNVFTTIDGGKTWSNTSLEDKLNKFYPIETSEVRYLALHKEDTDGCRAVPCLFASVGVQGGIGVGSGAGKFATIWRARLNTTECAATGGICWDDQPLITFNDNNARSKSLKGNPVRVGQELFVPTNRCGLCTTGGPRIYRRDSKGAWTIFYQADTSVEQIRALYFDPPTRRLFAAMNFSPPLPDRVFRFDTVNGALLSKPVDEGTVATYPYQLAPFTAQDGTRYLVATSQGKSWDEPFAALTLRPLDDSTATWKLIEFPSIREDPSTDGLSTAFRVFVSSPWTRGDIIIGGYDAYLQKTTDPHLTATGYRVTQFTASSSVQP